MESGQEAHAGEPREGSRSEVEPEKEQMVEGDATGEADATAEARAGARVDEEREPRVELFAGAQREEAERRWADIQARFVDAPRSSVEEANALVADLMDRLVSGFGAERSRLEEQWDRGEDVTTEELRIVLQRYRLFFSRLLEV